MPFALNISQSCLPALKQKSLEKFKKFQLVHAFTEPIEIVKTSRWVMNLKCEVYLCI